MCGVYSIFEIAEFSSGRGPEIKVEVEIALSAVIRNEVE